MEHLQFLCQSEKQLPITELRKSSYRRQVQVNNDCINLQTFHTHTEAV